MATHWFCTMTSDISSMRWPGTWLTPLGQDQGSFLEKVGQKSSLHKPSQCHIQRGCACAGRHDEQQKFYTDLYGRMEKADEVLYALIRQKEEFAKAACRLVVNDALHF